eukprot:scpid19696/ scgid6588/ 
MDQLCQSTYCTQRVSFTSLDIWSHPVWTRHAQKKDVLLQDIGVGGGHRPILWWHNQCSRAVLVSPLLVHCRSLASESPVTVTDSPCSRHTAMHSGRLTMVAYVTIVIEKLSAPNKDMQRAAFP